MRKRKQQDKARLIADLKAKLELAKLSAEDVDLLKGIREDAASWKQSHAERLLLDRLIEANE